MHAIVNSGKLTEVDTEAGRLYLEWLDRRTGMWDGHSFNFGQELEAEWEDLIGLNVDVVTIDDEIIRVTECNEQAE